MTFRAPPCIFDLLHYLTSTPCNFLPHIWARSLRSTDRQRGQSIVVTLINVSVLAQRQIREFVTLMYATPQAHKELSLK